MSNVLVEKNKLDILANAISNKSGESLKLTLNEMIGAVDRIKTEVNLQEKQYSVNKAGQELIQADSGYDGLSNVIVNTPSGSVTGPTSTYYATMASNWGNNNGTLRVKVDNIPTTPSVLAGYVSSANSSSRSVYVPTTIPFNPTVTVSGNTVTIPNGYYPLQQTKTVSGGTSTLQNKTVTPTTSQQTVNADSGYDGLDTVTVEAIPQAWGAGGDIDITYFDDKDQRWARLSPWTYYQFGYVDGETDGVPINVNAIPTGTTVTPTESAQTIGGADTMMEGAVTVSAIPSNYVGSGITRRSSSDLTNSLPSGVYRFIVPAGYYAEQATKDIAKYDLPTPTISIDNSTGVITATSFLGNAGYINIGTKIATEQLTLRDSDDLTVSGATVTAPSGYYSASASKSVASGTYNALSFAQDTPAISVDSDGLITASTQNIIGETTPVSLSGYFTSEARPYYLWGKTATEQLQTQGAVTITPSTSVQTAVTAGKYTTGAVTVAAMPSGTAGTPTATKGSVSNYSVSVTPTVTNTTGYITGGTKNGTAVTVSASELVSGTKTVTTTGTSDVTNYASVNVNISFSTIYTGSSNPSSSTGSNGDIYLKVVN